jgi:hypothetical protein
MTSNGIASAATQAHAYPQQPGRIAEVATVKTAQTERTGETEAVAESAESRPGIPSQIYNNHGQVVPSPGSGGTDFTA